MLRDEVAYGYRHPVYQSQQFKMSVDWNDILRVKKHTLRVKKYGSITEMRHFEYTPKITNVVLAVGSH
jgi:hypothetical protein